MAYDNADMHGIDVYTRTGVFFLYLLYKLIAKMMLLFFSPGTASNGLRSWP